MKKLSIEDSIDLLKESDMSVKPNSRSWISQAVEDRLEQWDLYIREKDRGLVTGKSWGNHFLGGAIARKTMYGWNVRDISGFHVEDYNGTRKRPSIDFYSSWVSVKDKDFVTYMDLFSDVVHKLSEIEHSLKLAIELTDK